MSFCTITIPHPKLTGTLGQLPYNLRYYAKKIFIILYHWGYTGRKNYFYKKFFEVLSMVVHRNNNVKKMHPFLLFINKDSHHHFFPLSLVLIYIIYTSCRNLYFTVEKFAV